MNFIIWGLLYFLIGWILNFTFTSVVLKLLIRAYSYFVSRVIIMKYKRVYKPENVKHLKISIFNYKIHKSKILFLKFFKKIKKINSKKKNLLIIT